MKDSWTRDDERAEAEFKYSFTKDSKKNIELVLVTDDHGGEVLLKPEQLEKLMQDYLITKAGK